MEWWTDPVVVLILLRCLFRTIWHCTTGGGQQMKERSIHLPSSTSHWIYPPTQRKNTLYVFSHVMIMCSSCEVIWLSCDTHVIVMWCNFTPDLFVPSIFAYKIYPDKATGDSHITITWQSCVNLVNNYCLMSFVQKHLTDESWSKDETDHLFELCRWVTKTRVDITVFKHLSPLLCGLSLSSLSLVVHFLSPSCVVY